MLKKMMVGSTRQSAARKGTPRKNFTLTATERELDQLVAGISDLRVRAMVLLLIDTGLRTSELVRLDRDTIKVTATGAGEIAAVGNVPTEMTLQGREFYVSRRAYEAIRLYLEGREDKDPAMFIGNAGKRIAPDHVRHLIHRSCDQLGIKRFPLHELRARLALRLASLGSDSYTIAQVLGHSTTRLTCRVFGLPPVRIPPLDLQVN